MPTIVSSIGTNNRDFATVAEWEQSIPLDLVSINTRYIGELYNDSEFTGRVIINGGRTTSAACNIILRCAPGHSIKDHLAEEELPVWYDRTKGVGFYHSTGAVDESIVSIVASHTVIEGIQFNNNSVSSRGLYVDATLTGVVISKCFVRARPGGTYAYVASIGSARVEHSLFVYDSTQTPVNAFVIGSTAKIYNVGLVRPTNQGLLKGVGYLVTSSSGRPTINNSYAFGFANATNNTTSWNAASGNNATNAATFAGTNNLVSLVYEDQFVQPSGALANVNFRLKSTSALLDKGINLATTLGYDTDIYGHKYGRAWDIGPVENVEPAQATKFYNAPSIGYANVDSTDFVVGLNGKFTGSVIITPNDGGLNGIFTPTSVTVTPENPTATFKYKAPSLGEYTISLTNNAAYTNTSTTFAAANGATEVVWSKFVSKGRAGVDISGYEVGTDGVLEDPITVVPSDGAGGSFTPSSAVLSRTVQTATFVYNGLEGGNKTFTLTNTGTLDNPEPVVVNLLKRIVAVPTPSDDFNIVKSIGPGKDYANVKAFADYVRGLNLVTLKKNIIGEVYVSESVTTFTVLSADNASSEYMAYLQPVPGYSVADYDPEGAFDYAPEGVELNLGAFGIRLGRGFVIQNFRLLVPASSNKIPLSNSSSSATMGGILRRNRILIQCGGTAFEGGEYSMNSEMTDNLFIRDKGTGPAYYAYNNPIAERNTFVARDVGSFGDGAISLGTSTNTLANTRLTDNVFINVGPTPIGNVQNAPASRITNNITNQAVSVPHTGVTAITNVELVRNVTNDFRPVVSGPLQGTGSVSAIGTLDNRNVDRGGIPDIGCVQGSVIVPLAVATITSIEIDGQDVIISGTTTGEPTSGIGYLDADAMPFGASTRGPTNLTLTPGQFTIEWENVEPGYYKIPRIVLTNAGGQSRTQYGGSTVVILDVIANLVENDIPVPTGGAPIIKDVFMIFDNDILSVSGNVDRQGDPGCTMGIFVDPLPAGAPISPRKAINLMADKWGAIFNPLTGNFKVRVMATANGQTTTWESTPRKVLQSNTLVPLPLPA